MMNFIDPKTSFAFQRLFGTADRSEIARSLLNALLSPPQPAIAALEFFAPEQQAHVFRRVLPSLLARARYEDGSTAIIDVQTVNLLTPGKRLLFNAAKTYCAQLNRSPRQPEILPVVAVAILDFELFGAEANLISHFAFCEADQQFLLPDCELRLVTVELPKFTKPLDELETAGDRWLYFLRHAPELDELPDALAQDPALQQALALADESKLSREELDVLHQELLFIADQRQSVNVGLSEGLRRGIEQGLQQGLQQGIEQGREQGRETGIEEGRQLGRREGIAQGRQEGMHQGRLQGLQDGQLSIIRRLLARRFGTIDTAALARIEKLSVAQLENLAEAAWDFITIDDLGEWLDQQV